MALCERCARALCAECAVEGEGEVSRAGPCPGQIALAHDINRRAPASPRLPSLAGFFLLIIGAGLLGFGLLDEGPPTLLLVTGSLLALFGVVYLLVASALRCGHP